MASHGEYDCSLHSACCRAGWSPLIDFLFVIHLDNNSLCEVLAEFRGAATAAITRIDASRQHVGSDVSDNPG